MGMRATLYAISPEEYARALAGDPDFGTDAALDLDKAWHAIHFLLTGDTELRFLMDGAQVAGESVDQGGDYLVEAHGPDAVVRLRDQFRQTPVELLMLQFDPDRFTAADIYPGPWDASGRAYLAEHLQRLADFIGSAAGRGRAMAVVLA